LKVIGKSPRAARYALIVLVLGGLVAACGSASSSSTSGSAATSGTTTSAAASGAGGGLRANPARRAALVACLKQHGVTLPARPPGSAGGAGGPGGPSGGTGTARGTPGRGLFGGGGAFANDPKLRAALQACGAQLGFRGRGAFRARLSRAAITKYVACVRQHGYNLPNPNFSGKGPVFPANIRSNPKFQAASQACQSLLVPPPPNGSSSGTSTTSGA
jgi:hypothetical protein